MSACVFHKWHCHGHHRHPRTMMRTRSRNSPESTASKKSYSDSVGHAPSTPPSPLQMETSAKPQRPRVYSFEDGIPVAVRSITDLLEHEPREPMTLSSSGNIKVPSWKPFFSKGPSPSRTPVLAPRVSSTSQSRRSESSLRYRGIRSRGFRMGLLVSFLLPLYDSAMDMLAPDQNYWCAKPEQYR